ncbi:hypothetical protein SAMN04489835_2658 [Mycolicibacterium rutilum]|uniref:Uncharacterized protein n=1 Tax=Mycolicibacterium rutilum TaxID=370526 RepID=A0A1H6K5J8_MYCRU|nr:DUF6188 family protein [Mycolicibacterium rutilum]SEH66750.1 hypothetical protein SAMN04489835_2658 [Mycolicibacterium rutilum]
MYTQWIENLVVQRLSLHGGLVLDFDDYNEIVISCPLLLTLPAVGTYPIETVRIDPLRIATHERPLLNLAGALCTQAWSSDDGGLHLSFSRGHRIDVDPDAEQTAWELYGMRHGYMACLPQGRVRVVRHDLPDTDDANIVNSVRQSSAGSARQTH